MTKLADIIGPAAPHSQASPAYWGLLAASLIAVGLAVLLLIVWVRNREMRGLRRRVRRLRCWYREGRLSERETAYRVAQELGRTSGLKRITVGRPPPRLAAADRARWEQFVTRLDALRYQAGDGKERHGEIEALLTWAQGALGGRR